MEERRLTSVSDESNSSDSSEKKCSSASKLTRKRKCKHRHKVKKKLKSSKHVSSSSSSNSSHSTTDSDSSDSDNTTLKKHRKKPSHKKHSKKVSRKSHSPLSRYRSYLQSYYSNYSIACDDKLSIAPCSEFIKLALIQKDKKRRLYETTLHRGVDEILESKVPLELDSLLTVGTRLVLVEGPPGMGKSTLCWELCRKWKSLKSLQHYKIILLLKLRERRVQEATSLDEIFYHYDHVLRKRIVREACECEGEGFLLILDGFDEMPISVVKNENSLVMKLIKGFCLPRATLLVTSRPSALHQKDCFPPVYRHVEIVGFTDEYKVKYAEIAFQSEPDVLIHFKHFIFSNPIIKSILYIPVNCAIVTQVYSDIRRSRELNMPKTMTELYSTLILVLIKRYMIETNKWNAEHEIPNNLKDLPEDISANLKVLCQLAYNGLFKEEVQLIFECSDIEESLKQSGLCDSDVGGNFKHLGLMSEAKEMYVCEGTVTSYSFLRLSIQEFLAAWHVSDHPDLISEVKSRIIVDQWVTPHLNAFGRFLAGIMSKNSPSFPWFKNIFTADTGYIMHCLYEAQDSGSVVSCLTNLEEPSFDPTDPLDTYVFGYCVVHAPVKWAMGIRSSLLNVLVSSLTDHNKEIQGSFISMYIVIDGSYASKLKELPKCVVEHMNRVAIERIDDDDSIPVLCEWIPTLQDLNSIALYFSEPCKYDYKLYQAIQRNLQELTVSCYSNGTCTQRGVVELSKVISTSSTLEHVFQFYPPPALNFFPVLDAALYSSTVTSIVTNLVFRYLSTSNTNYIRLNVAQSLDFDARATQRIQNCITDIAHKCNVIWLVLVGTNLHLHGNFITIMNNSLHHNQSMKILELDIAPMNPSHKISTISRALQRDPFIPISNLRRSQSLCDMRTPHSTRTDKMAVFEPYKSPRVLSCPDLLEIQSLHDLHPLLHEALKCDELYYTMDNSSSDTEFISSDTSYDDDED